METKGVAQQVEARKVANFYFLQRVGQEVNDSDKQEVCQQVEVRTTNNIYIFSKLIEQQVTNMETQEGSQRVECLDTDVQVTPKR